MPSRPRRPHTAPGGPDGVYFLDEADGATFAPGIVAQGTEVRTDFAVGLPVVHRLESGRGHEQERHSGLRRHRLGDVGLARPGRPLEKHGPARGPAHPFLEGAVGQEEVERLHHFLDHGAGAHHVGQRHAHLFGAVQHVRRAASHEQRAGHDRAEEDDQEQARQVRQKRRRDARMGPVKVGGGRRIVALQVADNAGSSAPDNGHADDQQHDEQPAEAGLAGLFARCDYVRVPKNAGRPECRQFHNSSSLMSQP